MIDQIYTTPNTKVTIKELEGNGRTMIHDEKRDLFIFIENDKVYVHTWSKNTKRTSIKIIPICPFSAKYEYLSNLFQD